MSVVHAFPRPERPERPERPALTPVPAPVERDWQWTPRARRIGRALAALAAVAATLAPFGVAVALGAVAPDAAVTLPVLALVAAASLAAVVILRALFGGAA